MAVLSKEEREAIWCGCMRELQPDDVTGSLTKADYQTAIDSYDTWVGSTIIPSMAMILPAATKAALSTKEQVKLSAAILARRIELEVF